MEVHINGENITAEPQFHDALAELLNFGPHYGRNLAALRDRLLKDVERPVKLIWDSSTASKRQMGELAFNRILAILTEAVKQDEDLGFPEKFEFELR